MGACLLLWYFSSPCPLSAKVAISGNARLRRHQRKWPTMPCSQAKGRRILPHAFTRARGGDGRSKTPGGPAPAQGSCCVRGLRFDGLETVAGLRRLLVIAALDTLGLENSIARARTLVYLVGVAGKLLETGELEERLAYLENAFQGQRILPKSEFDREPEEPKEPQFSVEVDP